MPHTHLPILEEVRPKDIVLLHIVGGNTAVHRITHLDLLIPFLFAGSYEAFALERRLAPFLKRIDAAEVDVQLRRRE